MNPRYLAILDTPPVYLDLPPDFVAVAAPPANSSAQTRAGFLPKKFLFPKLVAI